MGSSANSLVALLADLMHSIHRECGGFLPGRVAAFLVKGHEELPGGGHENCPVVAMRSAHSRPPDGPRRS
jgi:hypothetical protein